MGQSLIAIATFVALVGGVIFGVKQYEKKSEQEDSIELLAKPAQPLEKPTIAEPPLVSESALEENNAIEIPQASIPEFEASFVEDPWNELNSEPTEEPTQTVLDLGEIPSAERDEQSYEATIAAETPESVADQLPLELTPVEQEPTEAEQQTTLVEEPAIESDTEVEQQTTLVEEPAIALENDSQEAVAPSEEVAVEPSINQVEPSEELEPRYQVEEVVIPPTIHDPKRPNNETLENLTQEVLAWGESKELKHLPKLLQNATSSDSIVRGNVAIALGQIAASHPVRKEIEQAIPVLGKLTQDSNLQVRQFAVQALGAIRSQKVLPYLQQALLSPSGSVKKAANDALLNLKLHYGKTPAMQMAQKMLEKPKTKA